MEVGKSCHYFSHYWLTGWTSLNFWDRTKQPYSQSSDGFKVHYLWFTVFSSIYPTCSKTLTHAGPGPRPVHCKQSILSDQRSVWMLSDWEDTVVGWSAFISSSFSVLSQGPPTSISMKVDFPHDKSTSRVKAGHMTGTGPSIYPIFLSMVMSIRADLRDKSICYDLTWWFHVKVSFQTPLVVCTSLLSYLMDGTSSYISLSRLKRWVSSFACLFQDQGNISQAASSRNPYILWPRTGSRVYLIKL